MLFELRDGASDRSFGVHVARAACFPRAVVAEAARYAAALEGEAARAAAEAEEASSGRLARAFCMAVRGEDGRPGADAADGAGACASEMEGASRGAAPSEPAQVAALLRRVASLAVPC
jgi:hypothetical protein